MTAPDIETPTSAQMDDESTHRRRGLRNMLVGFALFVPGLLLFLVARDFLLSTFGTVEGDQVTVRVPGVVVVVIGGPMAVGYVLLMKGIYSVVFGSRGQKLTAAWSVFRILFGLVVTIGMIVIAGMALVALR